MQTLLHIVETELLIALAVYAFAHGAVHLALRFLMGGKKEHTKSEQR